MNVGVEGRAAGGWVVSVQSTLKFNLYFRPLELAKLQIPGLSRPLGLILARVVCGVSGVKPYTVFSWTVQFKKTHIFNFYYERWGNSPGQPRMQERGMDCAGSQYQVAMKQRRKIWPTLGKRGDVTLASEDFTGAGAWR